MYRLVILFIVNILWPQETRGDIGNLRLISSWKSLDFAFPNADARQQAIDSGAFIPGVPVPIDVDVIPNLGRKRAKILITIPRFQNGVPATLGYITGAVSNDGNPLIAPYPNWQMNIFDRNCNHIISVYRVAIDECNRLWVLDNGKLIEDQICPPKLLIFNLLNDQLISTYEFPNSQVLTSSLFITPVVDIRNGQCDRAFVYIADVDARQLIVYDHRNRKSWNIQNKRFDAEPAHSNFTINNESFTLADGIFGLALGPLQYGERILFFHSLASVSEHFVRTSVIRNSKLFEQNPNASSSMFQTFRYKRPSQSSAEAMDRRGILFYPLLTETAVACWNSRKYGVLAENTVDVVAQNSDTLQFPSGMKIISTIGQPDQLLLMTVRFQKVMAGTINPNETNFRIQTGYVDELIRGTKCDPNSRIHRSYHGHHY